MRRTGRRLSKRLFWLVAGVLAVMASYVLLLAFPTPLFAHAARFDGYRVYSDEAIPAGLARVIEEAAWRVEAMEPGSHRPAPRVYLCNSQRRYAFFAFLARKSPESLAIGLSVANSMFVSVGRVERFRTENAGRLRHTRFEGNLAEVIAHEIAHFYSVEALGYRAHLAQPWWKSEGWAEYQANLAAIRDDPTYDLAARIDRLFDARFSAAPGLARDLWESQLLVEYLGGIEGYRLEDLIETEVTRDFARDRMMSWHRQGKEQPAGHELERPGQAPETTRSGAPPRKFRYTENAGQRRPDPESARGDPE